VGKGEAPLAEPAVAAEAYDREYYLRACMGADEWRMSDGAQVSGIYAGALSRARLTPGERLLDLGTGRGDLLPTAIQLGAAEAVGVDYSPAAIELAHTTLQRAGSPPGARAVLADARRVPAADESFDLVTMLDLVEHLTPAELTAALAEARRALRPGGRIFIHTAPNATVYELTYRIHRRARPGRSRRWPEDPRNAYERAMHVNEQTVGSLRRTLRQAGFDRASVKPGRWVHTDFIAEERPRRLYRALARVPGARRLAVFDLFATASRPSLR
jgi:ubiquinone/menaquinone biosynthesis C-methylase UbiE